MDKEKKTGGVLFHFSLPQERGQELVQLPVDEVEARLLKRLEDEASAPRPALWQLAQFYSSTGRQGTAARYVDRILALAETADDKAACLLAMGQLMEQIQDWPAAIEWYSRGRTIEPSNRHTWYFIHNNLGYCLNTLQRFAEGESVCRLAIEIDPLLPNAHKNLGLAYLGQGRRVEAAGCFVNATQANASDARSLAHLEALVREHPDVLAHWSGGSEMLESCRKAVSAARAVNERLQPRVSTGWRARWLLLKQDLLRRLRRWFG